MENNSSISIQVSVKRPYFENLLCSVFFFWMQLNEYALVNDRFNERRHGLLLERSFYAYLSFKNKSSTYISS